jgi:hypothetical protein
MDWVPFSSGFSMLCVSHAAEPLTGNLTLRFDGAIMPQ